MRENSEYPISSFKDNACPGNVPSIINTSPIEPYRIPHPSISQDAIDDISEPLVMMEDEDGDNLLDDNQGTNMHPDTNSTTEVQVMFEYPSDVSHYTLDESKPLTEAQKSEHKVWAKEKSELKSNFSYLKGLIPSPPKSKECINIGDVISYVPEIFVQEASMHRTESTVLAVCTDAEDDERLELLSRDRVRDFMYICRKQI